MKKLKKDLKAFLRNFQLAPKLKKGDLLLVGEVMRVISTDYGKGHWQMKRRKTVEVATVFPICEVCRRECTHRHIMDIDSSGGQQVVMKLKVK